MQKLKVLIDVTPSAEQLPIISNPQSDITLIRGAAGSGKTTTALLMLKQLSEFWLRRRERNNSTEPVRILVLTFNRTLRGYITHLAEKQINFETQIQIKISTFGKWAWDLTRAGNIIENDQKRSFLSNLALKNGVNLPPDFLYDEVDYCLGRFLPPDLDKYILARRLGRGKTPRMEQSMRRNLLEKVIYPYVEYKEKYGLNDWNDLAIELLNNPREIKYDILITDETQDFSANEIRAVMKHVADPSTIVFVLDAAQRIYPRGWAWKEVNIDINPKRSFPLKENHRNTIEICALARPLLEGLELTDDGTMPDLNSCKLHGEKPKILKGKFSQQCSRAIFTIKNEIDLDNESVAFIHPRAGLWFGHLRDELNRSHLQYVELTGNSDWPEGSANIALVSMHSSKGLEFDHIFILGLNEELTPHGVEDGDTAFENYRRLLAMVITRARRTVTIGCKSNEASSLLELLDQNTIEEISL
ncbi:hypothetical protein C0389_06920 [bacterium]|nr:hypothetical protein [bacterium]